MATANKPIGSVIRFDTYWEIPNGKQAGTVIAYDVFQSKYKVSIHSFDGKPNPYHTGWIFPDLGRKQKIKGQPRTQPKRRETGPI